MLVRECLKLGDGGSGGGSCGGGGGGGGGGGCGGGGGGGFIGVTVHTYHMMLLLCYSTCT